MSLDRSGASQAGPTTTQSDAGGTTVSSKNLSSSASTTSEIFRLQQINHLLPRNLPAKAKPLSRFRYALPDKQSPLGLLFAEMKKRDLLQSANTNSTEIPIKANAQSADERLAVLETLPLNLIREETISHIVDNLTPETVVKLRSVMNIFEEPIDLAELDASARLKKLLDLKHDSAHWCIRVVKTGQKNPGKFYYLKINDIAPASDFAPMSELEAVCWSHYRLYLDDLVPHDVCAVYDDNAGYRFIGVASENMLGFEPFRKRPITDDDLNLGLFPFELVDIDQTFSDLIGSLNGLLKHLEESNAPSRQKSSLFSLYKVTTNFTNFYTPAITGEYTSAWFKDDLTKLRAKKKADPREFLDELSSLLLKRLVHIFPACLDEPQKKIIDKNTTSRDLVQSCILSIDQDLLKNQPLKKKEWETERTLLRTVLHLTQRYREECLANKQKLEQAADLVQKLVTLDRLVKEHNINLHMLAPETNVCELVNFASQPVSVRQLQKYQRIAGQGRSLIAFLYGADHDRHPFNLSSDGMNIDFDLSKINILIKYKKAGLLEKWNITPSEDDFKLTPLDIVKFPVLENARPRCHPTRQNSLVSSHLQYTDTEATNYKKLANNPIYDFFKYKTLLKILLTTPAMHECLTKLHIRQESPAAQKSSEDMSKKLFREIVDYDADRLTELRTVMTKMHEQGFDQFQEFLKHHGNFAFQLILSEFQTYREHLIAAKKSYYDNLIKEIDPEKIKVEFVRILSETKCDEVLIKPAEEIKPEDINMSFVAMSVYAPSPNQTRMSRNL